MLERLAAFFQGLAPQQNAEFSDDDTRVLAVALCFQVMEADGLIQPAERKLLKVKLRERLGLDDRKLEALLQAGRKAESEAVDYYRFTSELKRRLDAESRLALVHVLWDIVYADGVRNEMEEHILWRIADLLGISDRERILARQDAARRAGRDGENDGL